MAFVGLLRPRIHLSAKHACWAYSLHVRQRSHLKCRLIRFWCIVVWCHVYAYIVIMLHQYFQHVENFKAWREHWQVGVHCALCVVRVHWQVADAWWHSGGSPLLILDASSQLSWCCVYQQFGWFDLDWFHAWLIRDSIGMYKLWRSYSSYLSPSYYLSLN